MVNETTRHTNNTGIGFSKHHKIAIDGPAASGKSTVAKLLATKLGYLYIDSGAMYRAVTYKWLERTGLRRRDGVTPRNDDAKLLNEIMASIDIKLEDNSKRVIINGDDLTDEIRTNNVSNNVSYVAGFTVVREKLVDIQRKISESESVVMDGRDIGTVVFPNADYKFFVVASAEVRASRRLKDLQANGEDIDLVTLIQQIKDRDKKDSEREVSPLVKAKDAIEINTDNLSIDEVLSLILDQVKGPVIKN